MTKTESGAWQSDVAGQAADYLRRQDLLTTKLRVMLRAKRIHAAMAIVDQLRNYFSHTIQVDVEFMPVVNIRVKT